MHCTFVTFCDSNNHYFSKWKRKVFAACRLHVIQKDYFSLLTLYYLSVSALLRKLVNASAMQLNKDESKRLETREWLRNWKIKMGRWRERFHVCFMNSTPWSDLIWKCQWADSLAAILNFWFSSLLWFDWLWWYKTNLSLKDLVSR